MIGSALVVSMITFCNYTKANNNGNFDGVNYRHMFCFTRHFTEKRNRK